MQATTNLTFTKFGTLRDKTESAVLKAFVDGSATTELSVALKESQPGGQSSGDTQRLRALLMVVADLSSHGWRFAIADQSLLASPGQLSADESRKEYVRRVQMGQREQQLLKPSIREFVRSMEKKRLGTSGWASVYSLFRDGKDLGHKTRASGRRSLCSSRRRPLYPGH